MSEVDVVAVGSGAAGLMTALAAAERGASVTVLEATDKIGGTTAFSGALLWAPFNRWQEAAGTADSRAEAEAYVRECIGDRAGDPRWTVFFDTINDILAFLEQHTQLRFALTHYPDSYGELPTGRTTRHVNSRAVKVGRVGPWLERVRMPPNRVMNQLTIREIEKTRFGVSTDLMTKLRIAPTLLFNRLTGRRGLGYGFVVALLEACLARGVRFELSSRVVELVSDGSRISGVVVERGGERFALRARRGVMLGCGGFDHNDEMMRQLLPGMIEHTQSPPVGKGDNIMLARQAGAELRGTDEAWYLPGFNVPGLPPYEGARIGFSMVADRVLPHQIFVNPAGRRFVNESAQNAANAFYEKDAQGRLVNLPCHSVFDAQYRARYKVFMAVGPDQPDPPWLFRAASLAQLADQIGVDGAALQASVDHFNKNVRAGRDPDFGRGDGAYERYFGDPKAPHPNLGTIEKPPFFAVRVSPSSVGTKGGAMTNERGQVLRDGGGVVQGLYAAGNAAAAFNGPITVAAGCTIPPALAMAWASVRDMLGQNA